jgi:hypothetical protein
MMSVTEQREYILSRYWATHPRYCWFASQVENGEILHVRSGESYLAMWRRGSERDDLILDACDTTLLMDGHAEQGFRKEIMLDVEHNSLYGPFNREAYSGILISHVVHAMINIDELLESVNLVLANHGTAYFEWVNVGRDWQTEIINGCVDRELNVSAYGVIHNPLAERAMIAFGQANNQKDIYMMGYSSIKRLEHYLIVEKTNG